MAEAENPFREIDLNRLEEEAAKHPKRVMTYADLLSKAKYAVGEAEAELKVHKADLDFKIRKDPAKYQVDKPTDAAVAARVVIDAETKRRVLEVLTLQKRVDYLEGVMTHLSHQKAMLEQAVYLWGAGYFAAPRHETTRTASKVARTGYDPRPKPKG